MSAIQQMLLDASSGSLSDPYFSSVVLLAHMDGTNGSTSFPDNSTAANTITASGSAQVSTTSPEFGTGSALFNGTTDYLSIPTSTNFDLGSTYTVEFWAKFSSTAANQGLLLRGSYNTGTSNWTGLAFSVRFLTTPVLRFYLYGLSAGTEQHIDVAGAPTTGVWAHYAMVLTGTVATVYVNGVASGTLTGITTPAASTQPLIIGDWPYVTGHNYFSGNIDDLRITKGVARYTANFTPPTSAFPNS